MDHTERRAPLTVANGRTCAVPRVQSRYRDACELDRPASGSPITLVGGSALVRMGASAMALVLGIDCRFVAAPTETRV